MSRAAAALRRRTLVMLGAAAAVCALAGAASFIPPAQNMPRAEVGQLVLPEFAAKAGAVALVMVTTEEESYHLVKNPDGWVMPEKGNYPINPARIQDLTQALSQAAYARPMTRDEKKFDRIGLGDPARGGAGALIEVGDGAGNAFAKLLVGHRDGRSYIRKPDDLQAWAVDKGVLPPLQRASRWLDLNVAPLKAEEILTVDVRPSAGPSYRLVKNPEGGFSLAPPHNLRRPVAALAPTMAAQALTRFSPVDVAPAVEIAVGRPAAEYVVHTEAGVFIIVRSWKAKQRGWVTISAATSEGAALPAQTEANGVNARAAPWAFALTELDWSGFSTPLAELAE
jgi:hypothetical protein